VRKFRFPICGKIDKNAAGGSRRELLSSQILQAGKQLQPHRSAIGIKFPRFRLGFVISVTPKAFGAGVSAAAQLDRFRDLLPHLGLKQRAVRIFAFVSEDETRPDARTFTNIENHESRHQADRHFAARFLERPVVLVIQPRENRRAFPA
jgi:hypothetical protein